MKSRVCTVLVVVVFAPSLLACSFCSDTFARRQPLRERFTDSQLVLAGQLKNPVANTDGTGSTEFHITKVLKGEATVKQLTIPRYLPVLADTPPDYIFFCSVVNGVIEPTHGVAGGTALADYLQLMAKATIIESRLGTAFAHLESTDPVVANEAFLEFARASDTELSRARSILKRGPIRKWMADPNTPESRIGVYGLMLGLCGEPADADYLLKLIQEGSGNDRVTSNLGGLFGGAILLSPSTAWKRLDDLLNDPKRNFSDKLNIISTLRYFQATRPMEFRERIVASMKLIIANHDLADLAIDDLRRWQWWDLTPFILEQFDNPTHAAPSIRRGIVRYALQSPEAAAQRFIATLRVNDPELVKKVETGLKLYEKK